MTNFTVKCTKVLPDANKDCFYVGKTYRIENGRIKAESGYKFDAWAFNGATFENLQRWFENTFEFELVEEEKMFTKEDLRTGMEVLLRNGDTAYVVKDAGLNENDYLIWNNGKECLGLKDYDAALKFTQKCYEPSRYDIMRVFKGTSPINLFQKGECLKTVFDRSKGIGCEKPKPEYTFEVGENVEVIDTGFGYTTYGEFVTANAPLLEKNFIEGGRTKTHAIYKVVHRAKHSFGSNKNLYIIQDTTTLQIFIIGEGGLKAVEEDLW